jgi:hypothetical protein
MNFNISIIPHSWNLFKLTVTLFLKAPFYASVIRLLYFVITFEMTVKKFVKVNFIHRLSEGCGKPLAGDIQAGQSTDYSIQVNFMKISEHFGVYETMIKMHHDTGTVQNK